MVSYGEALIEVGARLAVVDRRPRELLARIESARGMVSLLPRATPPDDLVLASLLADLRAVTEELRTSTGDEPLREAQRRRATLEHRVRDHTHRSWASGSAATLTLREGISQLGEQQLIAYANLDGQLWAVTVDHGRCSMHESRPDRRLRRWNRPDRVRLEPAEPDPGISGLAGSRERDDSRRRDASRAALGARTNSSV